MLSANGSEVAGRQLSAISHQHAESRAWASGDCDLRLPVSRGFATVAMEDKAGWLVGNLLPLIDRNLPRPADPCAHPHKASARANKTPQQAHGHPRPAPSQATSRVAYCASPASLKRLLLPSQSRASAVPALNLERPLHQSRRPRSQTAHSRPPKPRPSHCSFRACKPTNSTSRLRDLPGTLSPPLARLPTQRASPCDGCDCDTASQSSEPALRPQLPLATCQTAEFKQSRHRGHSHKPRCRQVPRGIGAQTTAADRSTLFETAVSARRLWSLPQQHAPPHPWHIPKGSCWGQ